MDRTAASPASEAGTLNGGAALTIREWPESERPREKLLARGAHALSDAELLALLLGSGIPGCSAVAMARSLLKDLLTLMDVRLVDHIIVGENRCYSFAEHGLL